MCSANPELIVNELVNALNMEFFSARLKPRVKEPVTVLKIEFFPATPDAVVIEEVGLRVQLVATPA